MKFTVDSNYLICLLQSWNSLHPATLEDLECRLNQGQLLHIIPHTLLETYSVMTRMPDPFRKPPSIVQELMSSNFREFPLTAIPASEDAWLLLAELGQRGLGGGQTYDRWIAYSAHQSGMRALVTWNVKHFQPNTFAGLEIVRPSDFPSSGLPGTRLS